MSSVELSSSIPVPAHARAVMGLSYTGKAVSNPVQDMDTCDGVISNPVLSLL